MSAGSSHSQANDASKNGQQNTFCISEMVLKLARNCFLLVARLYITAFILAYEWTKKIVNKVLTPFEPIFVQVRKVPKKDINLEGIFYQFLRLQFLIFLYMTPFARNVVASLTTRVKGWAADLVGYEEKTRRVDAQN